jgi:hypothetical protein
MSLRVLDAIGGTGGGPVKLASDMGRARGIHVTVANPTATIHAVFFARSRRELVELPPQGQSGFAVVAVPNTVVNSTVGGVAYTSVVFQGYVGELWAVADIAAVIQIDVLDSAVIEK